MTTAQVVGAEQLLDDYNHYRFQTRNILRLRQSGKRIVSLGSKNLPVFAALATWCDGHRIESRRWVASLFEVRRWLAAPRLPHLKSPKHLKRYPTIGYIAAYDALLQQERSREAFGSNATFDPNRDLCPSAEALKRRYLKFGRAYQCMAATATETYGYHPRSAHCVSCPLQDACRDSLQRTVTFDIMGLRAGTMTAGQARAVAYYGSRGN